ncbi:hypothetical protein Daus18300_009305 [Diaporthe australafricana]|uniref:Para-hydroxybenzoate--polyprenyltransferase n=1 Tax=Diaporthe australafricana TaxID=127596 RepID=A0ABR3WEF7_9PEZI
MEPSKLAQLDLYSSPTTGVLSCLPLSWVPYAELIRFHKPAGILFIYVPYLLGNLFAASIKEKTPLLGDMAWVNLLLFVIAFVVRSVGCTWNDIVDREVDRYVSRSRHRPIARGAISASNGLAFMAAQYAFLFAIVGLTLPQSFPYLVPIITTGTLYPYAKQATYYAQVVLGVSLSTGVLFGCAAAGVDPIRLSLLGMSPSGAALLTLATSYVVWTVIHDTIYAFQDLEGDKKMGNKSMAVRFEKRMKPVLYALSATNVALLLATGWFASYGIAFYVGTAATGFILVTMVWRVDLSRPEVCGWWFGWGGLMGAGSLTASLLGEYLSRLFF